MISTALLCLACTSVQVGPSAAANAGAQSPRTPVVAPSRSFDYQLFSVLDWESEVRITLTELAGPGADLYVRRGAPPTRTQFDARSRTVGTSNEMILLGGSGAAPALTSGIWYAGVLRPDGTLYGLDIAKGPSVSERSGMGATPYDGGTTFRVWAPDASGVRVAGSFNGWNGSSAPLADEGNGHWSLDVRNVEAGDTYRFVLDTNVGTVWRIDPRAAEVTSSVGNGVVVDHAAHSWGASFQQPAWNDIVLYELHIGTF
ncbi:MAG: hypothetical protein AAGG01_07675, partial [Planctomycetota bacterium]